MADIVNPQITDSVTEAIQQPGHTPAVAALENLYMAISQALSNAAHNATAAQQNMNTILQATTTQGVAMLYSLDSASAAHPKSQTTGDFLGSIETVKSKIAESLETFQTSLSSAKTCQDQNPLHGGGFGEWSHTAIDGFAASLDRLNETQYRQSLRTLQIAAIASVLAALNRSPEQAQHFERILSVVKDLV